MKRKPTRRDPASVSPIGTLIVFVMILHAVSMTNSFSQSVTNAVPATADPWLAGMPPGTTASASPPPVVEPLDVAPAQSPVEVLSLMIKSGATLTFDATGLARFAPNVANESGPEGKRSAITGHSAGAEHGISGIIAPLNSLVGVFLGADRPDGSPAPSRLDFSSLASRDYAQLSPALKQVFFVGSGRRSDGSSRRVVVPVGASRLFLGVMDGFGWWDNLGSYTVTVNSTTIVPPTVPVITTDPSSQAVVAGNNVTFSVIAAGTAPLSYQWRKSGVNISGATSSTYTISNVQLSDAGFYSVAISNVAGPAVSQVATLTVLTPFPALIRPSNTNQFIAGLVSLWKAEGNASDSAGRNNGTLLQGVSFAPGKLGSAFNFNGTIFRGHS